MKNYLTGMLTILLIGTILYINVYSWHMTRGEMFIDPTTWICIFVIGVSSAIIVWLSTKNIYGEKNEKSK